MLQTASAAYSAALFRRAPDGLWNRWDVEPLAPSGVALDGGLDAEVNHGRWLVVCPCGGAQLGNPDVDRFYCVDCLNEAVSGLWRAVRYPPDEDGIDAALAPRLPINRNWLPGETVAELEAENDTNLAVL